VNPSRAFVHLDRLDRNLSVVRSLISPGVKVCVAVKAQAYGHGAVPVAKRLEQFGVEALGVATVAEGAQLRQAGITVPLLLFGATLPRQCDQIVELGLEPFVFDTERIAALARSAREQKRTLKVHLKVDTGMGRLGCPWDQAVPLARQIVHERGLEFEGLCTHFASSDGPGPLTVETQLARFEQARAALRAEGLAPRLVHAANSGALIDWPEAHFDMVRPGIAVYGYPATTQKRPNPGFVPLLEWTSEVVFVKEVPAGTTLSYGSRYTTPYRTKIATIPVGYADGWRRSFANQARIVVGNQTAQVSGTVCMDQFLVDLGPGSEVREGDRVVLLGTSGDPVPPSAEDLARIDGTIAYEILCGIGPRVDRVYTGERCV
jgi:alanine racemase